MKASLLAIILLLLYTDAEAQTIFSENMGFPSTTTSIANNIFQNAGVLTFGNGDQVNQAEVRGSEPSTTYTGASGGGNIFFNSVTGNYGFSIEGINASNFSTVSLQFAYRKQSSTSHAFFAVEYWNGLSWIPLANTNGALFYEPSNAPVGWYRSKSLALPSEASINGLKLRFVKSKSITIRIDDVNLSGIARTVPTFTQIAPLCIGGSMANLPLVSNNGIQGTWSPELDNSQTTTYTFTPTNINTATTASMIISIYEHVPTFAISPPNCTGTTLDPLPTTSIEGITGQWSPVLNNLATTNYVFTPATGQCATVTTHTIDIVPKITPTFEVISSICANTAVPPLPQFSIEGIEGTWSPSLNNLATTTYTFTPNIGQCAESATVTIGVNNLITPTFDSVTTVCYGSEIGVLPTVSQEGISGTWSPNYSNTISQSYIFQPNADQCATTTTINIEILPVVIPLFNNIPPICAGALLSGLPTTSLNGIVGTWSPELDNTVTTTYTFTPVNQGCTSIATLTIIVNPNIPTFNSVAPICAGGWLANLPSISNNGYSGTWYPGINNDETTEYTFTPSDGQCASATTLTIVVN
ncbi:MAG TPA: hypothetical protein VF602_08720, partial [Pedobacter sp.]